MLYGLDLFSGIGGITLALEGYVTPLAYCEIDPYCQSILLQRMQEGNLPKAPIWDDIRTFPAKELSRIDIIYGGFPCQDISIAGLQKGLEGKRSGLFFEILRILDETKAPFIFLENVPNIRTKGAERVCKELVERGYDCRWCNISASDVGARHKRERWFLLGYADNYGRIAPEKQRSDGESLQNTQTRENETSNFKRANCSRVMADSSVLGRSEGTSKEIRSEEQEASRENIGNVYETLSNSKSSRRSNFEQNNRATKSRFCRTADDISITLDTVERTTTETKNRVNRIKALGNSVVPLQVRTAFEILLGIRNSFN